MPEDHPFDEAMREATQREWDKAKRTKRELSPSLRATIHDAIRQKHAEKQPEAAIPSFETAKTGSLAEMIRRLMDWRIAFAAAAVVVAGVLILPNLGPKRVELAMSLPPLKGGTPTEAGTLVDPSVTVSVNWKKQTMQIPLKAGGTLTGQFKPATNAPPLPLTFDVALAGTSAGQPVNGSGQLAVMPQDPNDRLDRFSTNALLWVKLDLKLRAGGKEEPLYRVFGTP